MNSRFSTRYSNDSTRPMMRVRGYSQLESDDRPEHVTMPVAYRSRHISLHSRVDSLMGDGNDDGEEMFTSIPLPLAQQQNNIINNNKNEELRRPSFPHLVFVSEKVDHHDHDNSNNSNSNSNSNSNNDNNTNEYSGSSRALSSDPSSVPSACLPPNISIYHEITFVLVIILAQFMSFAGLGQAIAPMQYIAQDLQVSHPNSPAWFATAYALTFGTFLLICGRMGDILGHKRIFVFGYSFLASWSAFAGFSAYIHSPAFFNICRAFQGVGAALLVPNALALLERAYPPGWKKNVVIALYSVIAPWGFVLGGLFASLFAEVAWWPWAFWSYALAAWTLSALSILIIPRALAHDAQFSRTRDDDRPGWDLAGSLLGIFGLVLVSVAWNLAPLFGWSTPRVYLLLIIGIISLIAFIWVEARALSPIFPIELKALCSLIVVGLGWGSAGIWTFYSFKFLDDIRHFSALGTTAQFIPLMFAGLLAAGATIFLLRHTSVQFTLFLSMVAFFVGEIMTATQPSKQTYWAQMFLAVLTMPFGMAMSLAAGTLLLSPPPSSSSPSSSSSSNITPPDDHHPHHHHHHHHHQGLASSLVYAMVSYPISICLGIAGTVEVHVNKHQATREATLWGIRCAWWTGVALAGTAVVLSSVIFGKSLLRNGWRAVEQQH